MSIDHRRGTPPPAGVRTLLLLAASAYVAEAQTTLVEDGRPLAAIVVGAAATEEEQAAADEIRLYVKKISGAALPITSDTGVLQGPKILVGQNRLAAKLGVSVPQAIYPAPETILVKSVDGHVVVAGNDAGTYRGTYFAACALLEHLGVRWYWPGEVGEVVPRRRTVRVPRIDLRESPSFPFRLGLWYATGITPDTGPFAAWSRRNRSGGAPIFASHNLKRIVRRETFPSHPERFALIGGRRVRDKQPCTSAPATVLLARRAANAFFDARPHRVMFSLCQNDGAGYCECKRCRAIDRRPSGRLVAFCNAVSDGLLPQHAQKLLSFMAYDSRATEPPTSSIRARANVVCSLIHFDRACPFHSLVKPNCTRNARYRRLLDEWSRVVQKMIWSEHDNDSATATLPVPHLHCTAANVPHLRAHNIIGYLEESGPMWPWLGLNYYVTARLLWIVDADTQAIADEFYRLFFGRAGDSMRAFYDLMHERTDAMPCRDRGPYVPDDHALAAMEPHLATAEAAAAHTKVKARVAMVRAYFNVCRHWNQLRSSAGKWNRSMALADWRKAAHAARRLRASVESIPDPNVISRVYFERIIGRKIDAALLDPKFEEEVAARISRMRNLLSNPGFEAQPGAGGVPPGWHKGYTFRSGRGRVSYSIGTDEPHSGRHYLRVALAAPTAHYLRSETIPVVPGREYRMAFCIRAQRVSIIRIFTREFDEAGASLGRETRRLHAGSSSSWRPLEAVFVSQAKARSARLSIYISSIGRPETCAETPALVDLDDVYLGEGFRSFAR